MSAVVPSVRVVSLVFSIGVEAEMYLRVLARSSSPPKPEAAKWWRRGDAAELSLGADRRGNRFGHAGAIVTAGRSSVNVGRLERC